MHSFRPFGRFADASRGARRAAIFSLCFLVLFAGDSAGVLITLHSQTAVVLELVGYDGLAEVSLFKGSIRSGEKQGVDTRYQGLALLRFTEGQDYPVLLGDTPFTLHIASPAEPPAFAGSRVNEAFANRLAGKGAEASLSGFAWLTIQVKQLLDSSSAIRTTAELAAKKDEFRAFVRDRYESLRHSDMVRRLVAQYFMMHEYVNYHVEGAPATDNRAKYEQAVLDGTGGWLATLKPHLPEHETLNYIVGLYYDRSMVTLASHISEKFAPYAYCPGVEGKKWAFPDDLTVSGLASGTGQLLADINGRKAVAFVSADCPVSMVQTVMMARQIADQGKGEKLIVAPIEQMSGSHLAMNRMVSTGNMLFINDEQWRRENLAKRIRLPLVVSLEDDLILPERTSTK